MLRQTVEKPKKLSDNALAIIVIVSALVVIFFGKQFFAQIDFVYGNLILFAAATTLCCLLVIGRMRAYRYGADGNVFVLDRITGKKEKMMDEVGRKEMTALLPPGSYARDPEAIQLMGTVFPKETAYVLCYRRKGRNYRMLIHPNEPMVAKLNEMIARG